MTHATLTTLSRRALQYAALFLAVAPFSFGSELVNTDRETQLIGEMVVTATREPALMGHLVVTAVRPAPAYVAVTDLGGMKVTASRIVPAHAAVADLGVMTVTAPRESVVAWNDSPLAWHVAP